MSSRTIPRNKEERRSSGNQLLVAAGRPGANPALAAESTGFHTTHDTYLSAEDVLIQVTDARTRAAIGVGEAQIGLAASIRGLSDALHDPATGIRDDAAHDRVFLPDGSTSKLTSRPGWAESVS